MVDGGSIRSQGGPFLRAVGYAVRVAWVRWSGGGWWPSVVGFGGSGVGSVSG